MRKKQREVIAAKVRKPCSELNPRVWQGDCFMGIDQKLSEMFRNWRAGGPVFGAESVHYPDSIAMHRLLPKPPSRRGGGQVHGGRAIALTNEDAAKLFLTATRFSSLHCVHSRPNGGNSVHTIALHARHAAPKCLIYEVRASSEAGRRRFEYLPQANQQFV